MNTKEKYRTGIQVMAGLIGMVKPLLFIMFFAVFLGCAGNLMASFITILGVYAVLSVLNIYNGAGLAVLIAMMVVFAVLRGILRYGEQACNHYIAFKLLARIRHKVFSALRRLAPAKLDGSEKGNLISLITSDIELLEVFYAHTISPIAIAVITSIFMVIFIGLLHPAAGLLAAVFYLIVGFAIPVLNGRRGSKNGQKYRDMLGNLNTVVLDNLYGLKEILQFGQRKARLSHMEECTDHLEQTLHALKKNENLSRIITDWVILAAGIGMAILCAYFTGTGQMDQSSGVIAVVAMMSSFGPTAALSSLSNNLSHTLASGNRVLNLLEEEPVTRDVVGKSSDCGGDILCDHLSFSYESKNGSVAVLQDFSNVFNKKRIHGILGKSGCGKSTLLKLLMRFYETQQGSICYGHTRIDDLNTDVLRRHIAYVTQDTFLFHDTIENNIKIGHPDAGRDMVIEAAKKASIHDFILSLPRGYDTKLSELGDGVSGGERQRIGIARAFLHNSDMIFLDEPTSNIDSLNEAIILKSLNDVKKDKTIILVSHRASTMGIADHVIKI